MKAQDYRLGNLFDIVSRRGEVHLPLGLCFKVIGVTLFEIQYHSNEIETIGACEEDIHVINIRDVAPIELTEDWLKRFSIEKLHVSGYVIDGATYWKKGGIVFYEIKGKYYLPVGENITHGKTVIEFNKVHELQNIFALTGEELEIK